MPLPSSKYGLIKKLDLTSINSIPQNAEESNTKNLRDIDYTVEDNKAVMTQQRLDAEIEDSGAGSRTDYARSWITSISPSDFLAVTVPEKLQDREVFDKRDSMGRYSREDGYSRNDEMMAKLYEVMDEAPEHKKQEIKHMIEKLERM